MRLDSPAHSIQISSRIERRYEVLCIPCCVFNVVTQSIVKSVFEPGNLGFQKLILVGLDNLPNCPNLP